MLNPWETLLWLALVGLVMLLLKRWLSQHLQGLFFLLTQSEELAFIFYSALLFPGTLLHEFSHFTAAKLLGVHVLHASLRPTREKRGLMRLGFVEIEHTDFMRESLIGAAPLIFGSLLIVLIAQRSLGFLPAPNLSAIEQIAAFLTHWPTYFWATDLWLWLYVIFAISNGMLPSESDREAWPALGAFVALIALLLYLAGIVPQVPDPLAQGTVAALSLLLSAFVLTSLVDLVFIPPIYLVERVLEGLTGKKIRYHG